MAAKEKILTIWKQYGIYAVMFMAVFFVHLLIRPTVDDLWFGKILDSYSIWDFTCERYHTWASRSLIEALLIVMTHCPMIIWQILDSLVYVGIAWAMGSLIRENDPYIRTAACFFWMTYPFIHMNSAGYIATTLNYAWPLLAILAVLLFLKKQMRGETLSRLECVLDFICILYGANTEQGTAILLGAHAAVILYDLIRKKRVPVLIYVQTAAVLAEMLYILTCPGNAARIAYETEHLFPEYASLGLLRKIEMGVTSAMYHFLMIENIIFALFSFILWIVSAQYAKNTGERAVSAVPFALSMCFSMFSELFYRWFPKLEYFRYSLTELGTLFSGKPETILPCLVYAAAAAAILYCLYMIGRENWTHGFVLLVCIALGFGSRVMMGFSASIWASSDRTFIFLYTAFILASLYMLVLMQNRKIRKSILFVTGVTGVSMYLSLLVSVLGM